MRIPIACLIMMWSGTLLLAQNISDFISVTPATPSSNYILPSSHQFQKIIEHGDPLTVSGTMMDNFDFTAFVPINGSSINGHLSINHELTPGGVTVLDISFDTITQLWSKNLSKSLDFSAPAINGTARNCSGGITPWNNVISAEETLNTNDTNNDGYNDLGWLVEINPNTKIVVDKRWAMGCGPKENVVIHSNRRTAYFGNDANPGYLYKFVANNINDLSSGILYAYSGPKSGSGNWVLINNTTISDRNNTMALCSAAGATSFNGIEDVEIGPDGLIYFAVKNENCVYRLQDSDPITGTVTSNMITYVGTTSYNISHSGGTTLVPWGTGNDNLAFDGQGNLWVLQDGSNFYIWVVLNGHTQASPKVKLFGIAPSGSEPTGITFTPDFKYMFLSFQHPNAANNSDMQLDAANINVGFEKDIAIVIALDEFLGCELAGQTCNDNNNNTFNDKYTNSCVCTGIPIFGNTTMAIASSGDDVEENLNTGTVNASSSDLELVTDGSTVQKVGLRFNNINILKGASIDHAYLQFTTDETSSGTTTVKFHGEKTGNASPFNSANAYNLSNRIKTTDSIFWTIPSWTTLDESGPNQKSPDLKNILQEIVNLPSWHPGNSVVFIISGSGSRVARAFDANAAQAASLQIQYTQTNLLNVGIGTSNPQSKLQVQAGDIYIETLGSGVILKSPDGNCWRLTVTNTGMVESEMVTCPN